MSEILNSNCGNMPLGFFQALASCIVKVDGVPYLNVVSSTGVCDSSESGIGCDDNVHDLESLVVNSIFTIDDCGRPALRLYVNTAE